MKRFRAAFLTFAGIAAIACYQDDSALQTPLAIVPTKVYLTDGPFPFDLVKSVTIFVTTIEGSTGRDTTGAGTWVTIAAPNKSFDLLTLQQGATAFVGEGTIDAGKYVSIRMTIDVDQSSIRLTNDSTAVVQWPYPGHGAIRLYAVVEEPVNVPATIVIDFDVGRTFLYNILGGTSFSVAPNALRAVNSAIVGTIAGHVTRMANGSPVAVPNADISVYGPGNPTQLIATGRTDANGAYTVGFLRAGSYLVSIEQPTLAYLDAVAAPNVTVTVAHTSTLDVVLPPAGSGSPSIHVTGSDSVSTFGAVLLHASVLDAGGAPTPSPSVTWLSRDPSIATVVPDTPAVADSLANAIVGGVSAGTTWIVATSGGLADSLLMHVFAPAPPPPGIKTVTLSPPSLSLQVNDSVYFHATLLDSSGNVVTNGTLIWSILPGQDSTVVDVFSYGLQALIRARRSGNTIVRATEPIHGAHVDGSITVH